MPSINFGEINWLAVIVVALGAFMLGGMWYGVLFGTPWSKAQGWTDEQVAAIKAGMSPAKFFGGMIASYLVLATVIALLANACSVQNAAHGLVLGAMTWVIVACVTLTHHLASGKAMLAFVIDASLELIYLLGMGAVIGAWR